MSAPTISKSTQRLIDWLEAEGWPEKAEEVREHAYQSAAQHAGCPACLADQGIDPGLNPADLVSDQLGDREQVTDDRVITVVVLGGDLLYCLPQVEVVVVQDSLDVLVTVSHAPTVEPAPATVHDATHRAVNGATVRSLREAVGVPHGKFAIRVGISPGYLTHIEQGTKQPSPHVAVRIAAELAVPLDAITYPTHDGAVA